jgi:hypothetical protein
VLICMCKLGKVWRTNEFAGELSADECQAHGCDTAYAARGEHSQAWGGTLRNSEYCTYDHRRVAAAYALVFERKEDAMRA